MKETVYRCNKCHQPLADTRHKIAALNEAGKPTKYGALLEDIDLCENCMASVSLSVLDIVGDQERETEPGKDSGESQQATGDNTEETATGQQDTGGEASEQDMGEGMEETAKGQQEGQEHPPEDKKTYRCSKVIKTCRYAEKVGASLCCNYIVVAKHRRDCEPEQCDKYERVVRKRGRKPKKVTEA